MNRKNVRGSLGIGTAARGDHSEGPGQDTMEQEVSALVEAAIQGPSADTCQPLRFVWLGDGRIEVLLDGARAAIPHDSDKLFGAVALGAAFANLEIAAVQMGFMFSPRV